MKRHMSLDHLFAEQDIERIGVGIRALREHRDTLMTWAWVAPNQEARNGYVADARGVNSAIVQLLRLRTRIMMRIVEEEMR